MDRPGAPEAGPLRLERVLRPGAEASAAIMDRALRMNRLSLDFLGRRVERDRRLVLDLSDIGHPERALGALAEFCMTAQREYAEQILAMTDLVANGGARAPGPGTDPGGEGAAEVAGIAPAADRSA